MQWMSCNCGGIFAIVIANSNAARDDNFKILLNGTDIGHIDNNQHDYTGRIFVEDGEEGEFLPGDLDTPNPNILETTLALDMNLLVSGTNTLRVESIQDNGNGNFGTVRVGYWKKDPSLYSLSTTLLSINYSFASGVGNSSDLTFTY